MRGQDIELLGEAYSLITEIRENDGMEHPDDAKLPTPNNPNALYNLILTLPAGHAVQFYDEGFNVWVVVKKWIAAPGDEHHDGDPKDHFIFEVLSNIQEVPKANANYWTAQMLQLLTAQIIKWNKTDILPYYRIRNIRG